MKNSTLIYIVALLITQTLQAQEKTYPMPDYDNVPYYYNETDNTLTPLDKANYKVEAKSKGLWGAGIYIVIPDAAAKLRYTASQKPQFIIHFDDARTEPSTLYQLVPLTVNTKNNNSQREYMVKSSGVGHAETNTTQIAMNAKKIGDGLYLLTFKGEIPSGEFALSIEKTKQGYDFGIDGGVTTQEEGNTPSRPKDPLGGAIYDEIERKKAEKKGGN